MGLLDLTSEVLTEYRADVSDHKAKVKELQGEEKALAQVQLEAAEARNEHLEGWVEKLGKVSLALVAVKEVGELVWDGYKEGIKEARLETAAMGIDIEKLGEAAGGLKTHMELLEFAAKANKSAFHNTQEDMEMAERAMRAMEARGYGAADAQEAVTKALVEGKTKGLAPFGIEVDKHIEDLKSLGEENLTLAQKTEIHRRAMEDLKIVADAVSDSHDNVGDSMARAEVSLSNAWAELKKSIGGLVGAMAPLIEGFAWILGHAGDIAKGVGVVLSPLYALAETGILDSVPDENNILMGYKFKGGHTKSEAWSNFQQQADMGATVGKYGRVAEDLRERFQGFYADPNDVKLDEYKWSAKKQSDKDYLIDRRLEMAESGPNYLQKLAGDKFGGDFGAIDTSQMADIENARRFSIPVLDAKGKIVAYKFGLNESGRTFGEHAEDYTEFAGANGFTDDPITQGLAGVGRRTAGREAEINSRGSRYADWNAKQEGSRLEKIFGKLSDFDLYSQAFKALEGATGKALSAWIDGSESAGQAFKRFISETVKGLAIQMGIEAIKHGAYALGSLAFGDVAGAARHAAAAGEFALGAAAAAIAARELGSGAPNQARGGGGAGGSAPPPSNSNMGSVQGGGATRIIVYGDSFADDSPRMRQRNAERMVGLAMGDNAVSNG